MTFEVDIDPQRITRAMRANVEALSSTADMISVLVEEAERQAHDLQQHVESQTTVHVDDWRVIKTFLRLAASQADIVKETCDLFRDHTIAALAA